MIFVQIDLPSVPHGSKAADQPSFFCSNIPPFLGSYVDICLYFSLILIDILSYPILTAILWSVLLISFSHSATFLVMPILTAMSFTESPFLYFGCQLQ
jgi:hypothetical protein